MKKEPTNFTRLFICFCLMFYTSSSRFKGLETYNPEAPVPMIDRIILKDIDPHLLFFTMVTIIFVGLGQEGLLLKLIASKFNISKSNEPDS